MPKPHILLVHGAWHRAWHLQPLATELQKYGYQVSTVDLPAGGPDAPETGGLEADANAIKDLMETAASTSESILPVFHSYAGVAGSEAVALLDDETAKKISQMIYLAAFVIPAGEALIPWGRKIAPWTSASSDGKYVYVPDPITAFYHDVDPSLAKEAAEKLVRYSMSAFRDTTKYCGWKRVERKTFVYCTEDRALPNELLRGRFEAMSEEERKGWEFEEIEGDHSPFLARVGECARMIRRIAGEEGL